MARKTTAAEVLRALRESQGQSLRSVASDVGVAASQLSRVERGERSYAGDLAERLASYYGVSREMLELLEGRVPVDIVAILQEHPEEIARLREQYGGQRAGADVDSKSSATVDPVPAE